MELNLGTLKMPINAATKSFAVLAKRGAGKTYLGGVMAEEFTKCNIPFVVFDPIDVWWGLRVAADGKGAGLPVVVFGLRHQDIELDRNMGREIARAVVSENISCVISTFGMPKVAMRHLVAEFAEELLHINNTPRHVFIEEAHEYVPQRIAPGSGKTFAAVEALVTMGRNQGIGVTMLNQRAATINKDVLTQIDTLLALRSVGPQDRDALQAWVEEQEAEGDFKKFIADLSSLPTGTGWVWSPEFLGVFEKFKIRKRETFHPDREKTGGFVMPTLDQGDVQSFIGKFKTQIAEAEKKALPGKARKTIDREQRKLVDASFPVPAFTKTSAMYEIEIREMKNKHESDLMQTNNEIRRLNGVIGTVRRAVGATDMTLGVGSPTSMGSPTVEMWKGKLGNTSLATRILTFLSENTPKAFSREQVALAIGVTAKAGHTSNEWGRLMRTQTVIKQNGMYKLNPNL